MSRRNLSEGTGRPASQDRSESSLGGTGAGAVLTAPTPLTQPPGLGSVPSGAKAPPPRVRYGALLGDALLLAVAVALTALTLPANGTDWDVAWLSGSALGTLALLGQYGFYRRRFSPLFLDEVRLLVGASAVGVMGSTFIRVLLFDHGDAADVAARGWAVAIAMLVAGHAGQRAWTLRAHRKGRSGEPTMIVGAGEIGSRVARRLLDRGDLGLRPVVFLDDDPLEMVGRPEIPVLPAPPEGAGDLVPRLERIVDEYSVAHVVLTFSNRSDLEQLELLRACQGLGLTVSVIPRLFEGVPDRTTLERLGGLPMIAVHPANPRGLQFAMKYAMDRAVAALLDRVGQPGSVDCCGWQPGHPRSTHALPPAPRWSRRPRV